MQPNEMFDLQRRSMRGLYKIVYHVGYSGLTR